MSLSPLSHYSNQLILYKLYISIISWLSANHKIFNQLKQIKKIHKKLNMWTKKRACYLRYWNWNIQFDLLPRTNPVQIAKVHSHFSMDKGQETKLTNLFMLSLRHKNEIRLHWPSMSTTPWHCHLQWTAQCAWHKNQLTNLCIQTNLQI